MWNMPCQIGEVDDTAVAGEAGHAAVAGSSGDTAVAGEVESFDF